MGLIGVFVFYCVMCSIGKVTLANEKMKGTEEVARPDVKTKEESPEKVPPDSHEAMHDREGARAKRSYEFLVGLINNNSRYEVTRVDPALTTQRPKIVSDDVSASEILLELMVRIAAHPAQWRRVHTLLKSIDDDLTTSNNVIKKLQKDISHQITQKINKTTNNEIRNSKSNAEEKDDTTRSPLLNASVVVENTKKKEKPDKPMVVESTWPTFEGESEEVVSRRSDTRSSTQKPSKSTYPKNFIYHRVTGSPIDVNKSPRAYIAVSVIAPKPTNTRSKEDAIALENELHQLKPWSHQDNLQKMASIRSRWIIGQGEKKARGW